MKDGKSIFVVLVLTVFVVYVMRNFLGRFSAFFFVPIDNLLFISHSISPVLMWMIFGLLIGSVYGSFIAIKKYKLDYKLLVYPALVLLIGFVLILLASFVTEKIGGRSESGGSHVEVNEANGKFSAPSNQAEWNDVLKRGIQAVENEDVATSIDRFLIFRNRQMMDFLFFGNKNLAALSFC
ncbi:hypothetical protein [Dyadobacter sp. LHD-138]|uniref:hypothetical protein n=1 Tax=Dyadobacter sp. LHD-138 TaxID=3071413 RepID=UPI0027DF6974|nr:hypothetical protein [Dyadobacter sp. LHD-138]MDQ6480682.1 hypothetical protein [Dyadobacter sp. LHD-138]